MDTAISSGRIFFALSDATRRQILESLYSKDGQRPVEIQDRFEISRQAVLKHLRLLEDVGLITAQRSAGETVYYLNRAPLRLHVEWLAKFTQHSARIDHS